MRFEGEAVAVITTEGVGLAASITDEANKIPTIIYILNINVIRK